MTAGSSPIALALDKALWLTSTLPIRLFGDPILTTPCQPVSQSEIASGQLKQWGKELTNFLSAYREHTGTGRGLAANQIGIDKQLLLIMPEQEHKIYANPRLVSVSGEAVYPETCISSAALIIGDVKRARDIKISYIDINGKAQQLEASGLKARLILHEMDHLQGKLCTDSYLPGTAKMLSGDPADILIPDINPVE